MTQMPKIRVLIVDDAVVIRKLLGSCLSEDPELEVVGTAGDGASALARLAELKPDIVTLDIEMPGMDGIQALDAIRKIHPRLPVIMFSIVNNSF